MLFDVWYLLLGVRRSSWRVVRCVLCVVCRPLLVMCHVLCDVRRVLFVGVCLCCLLNVWSDVCCLWIAGCRLLFAVCCLLFAVCVFFGVVCC